MKIITSGVKQRHCGRWFYFDSHGRWNLMRGDELEREIRKTKYVVVKYTREYNYE